MNRALTTTLLTGLLTLVALATSGPVAVSAGGVPTPTPAGVVTGTDVDDGIDPDVDTPGPTVNEFLPEQRSLGDCLSSLPKPDCGSEARGGWAQTVVLLAIVAGLAFIAWRVVAGSRRARRRQAASVRSGTPDATSVPDAGGDGPAP